MENYHYSNQKTEIPLNQDKLLLQFNKNFQYQNLFRGDSNINKQKGRIFYLNNKKEIHFTTRAKENEIPKNGPKIFTMNFPPGFMKTDNNNNSRKTASHEKNIYLQQNMANNMELYEIGSDNEKIFSNTVKKGFQDYNENDNRENLYNEKKQNKKNLDILGQKQKSISIKLNNNENFNNFQNLQKKYIFYNGSGSSVTGFNSTGNTGYIRSETELNSGRGGTSSTEKEKEQNYDIILSHIRTEGSDLEIPKKNSNGENNNNIFKSNSNMPFTININSQQNNKVNSNLIYSQNFEYELNNNYSSNNSNNSKEKFPKNNVLIQKNSNVNQGKGSLNSNKLLVFNPSSITNQRMIKKNSDSELCPSSIKQLYLGNQKYKDLKPFNENLNYYNVNDNFQKSNNNYYHYNNKSEIDSKLSLSPNSQSKEKNNTKTQTNFEKKSRPNYYENLINELGKRDPPGSKLNINSAAEYNINILENFSKIKKIDINCGIIYKINNGYKYFFNILHGQIYLLKECNLNYSKDILPMIKSWNKTYENDSIYLKIYENEIDSNKRQIIIIQYPIGGESLNDIINSVGFYDHNYLFDIVTKIYKSIIKIKKDKNSELFQNIPFCLCDIFINVNDHIKIIPPMLRHINPNNDKNYNSQSCYYKQCKCKYHLYLLQILFNINKDSISFFCLGLLIIQIITQNLIFELNSFKSILKKNIKANINIINSNNNISSYKSINKNNNYTEKKSCCLTHLLLEIEKQKLDGKEYLLFSHFLNLYPKSLLTFLHECTSFRNNIPSSSNEFLNLYDTSKNLNLSIKEILEITTLPKNDYKKLDSFLSEFEILYKDISINTNDYIRKLNSNKVIQVLSRAFCLDKEKFMNLLFEKIRDKDNNLKKVKDNNIKKYKDKNKFKEKNFFEDNNTSNMDYFSSFIRNNKNNNNNNNSNNIINKQNYLHQLQNYRSSENYEYEYI